MSLKKRICSFGNDAPMWNTMGTIILSYVLTMKVRSVQLKGFNINFCAYLTINDGNFQSSDTPVMQTLSLQDQK